MASEPNTKYDQEPIFTKVTVQGRVSIDTYYIYAPYSHLSYFIMYLYHLEPLHIKIHKPYCY